MLAMVSIVFIFSQTRGMALGKGIVFLFMAPGKKSDPPTSALAPFLAFVILSEMSPQIQDGLL